jgi:hypothetical protein
MSSKFTSLACRRIYETLDELQVQLISRVNKKLWEHDT